MAPGHTHRVAIANQRLLGMDDGHVGFRCQNYRAAFPGVFLRRCPSGVDEILPRGIGTVPYAVQGGSFHAEKPRWWADTDVVELGPWYAYDAHPDRQRLVGAAVEERLSGAQDHVVLVSSILEHLRRLLPMK